MGNPCASPIAMLFLDRFERSVLEGVNEKPAFFVRYIDDYAGIWCHGEQALVDFVAHLNSLHPTLRFTLEHSGGGSAVPFIDTLVTLVTRGNVTRIETELHYHSAHPKSTKYNIVRNQFRRAIRNSSSASKEKESVKKVWVLLVQNSYPEKVLNRLLREVQRKRTPARAGGGSRGKHGDLLLCLPYLDEQLLCKIKSKVRKSGLNIRIAWKNPQKLRNKLIRSSMTKPRCPGGPRCHTCASGFSGDCTKKMLYIV